MNKRIWIISILAAAFVARVLVAVLYPNLIHPDETQYMDQAYRVVSGKGLIPWEFQIGARSWILPGLLLPAIAIVHGLSSVQVAPLAVAIYLSALSLIVVFAAYGMGRRAAGELGGVFAALLTAFWPEIVLLAPHPLADTICAIPLLAALAVGYRPGTPVTERQLIATGALLAFALGLRPQLLLPIGVAGVWLGLLDWRRYRALCLGGLPVVLLFGLTDWLTWGDFLGSFVRYVRANSIGVASFFSESPVDYYVWGQRLMWGWTILPIGVCAALGARRLPLLAVMGLLILFTFSMVAHKEMRFIYPAIILLFILAGAGTAEATRWLSTALSRLASPRFKPLRWALAAGVWLAAGTAVVAHPTFQDPLHRHASLIAAIDMLNADPQVCGVAVAPSRSARTGFSRMRSDIGLYVPATQPGESLAYNAILLTIDRHDAAPKIYGTGFGVRRCFGDDRGVCVLTRPNRCDPEAGTALTMETPPELQKILKANNLLPPR